MWKLAATEGMGKPEFMAAGVYMKKNGTLPEAPQTSLDAKPDAEPVEEVFGVSEDGSGNEKEDEDITGDDESSSVDGPNQAVAVITAA